MFFAVAEQGPVLIFQKFAGVHGCILQREPSIIVIHEAGDSSTVALNISFCKAVVDFKLSAVAGNTGVQWPKAVV